MSPADNQPHGDGTLEPLSDLATPPSYFRTWPFSISLKAARRLAALLPPAAQTNLPSFLLQAEGPDDEPILNGNGDGPTQPLSAVRSMKKGKKARDTTPRDSPAATEGESEDGDEVNGENGEAAVEKKKKKPGLGKAGGARRRKMAMK